MRTQNLGLVGAIALSLFWGAQGLAQDPEGGVLPGAPPVTATAEPPSAMHSSLPPMSAPEQPSSPSAYNSLQNLTDCQPDKPATPATPPPYGGPFLERSNLLGDWGGARGWLREHGLTFNMYSTNFYTGVTSGGLQDTFKYRGRADYLVDLDGEKAGLWKGSFVTLHGETVYGDSINSSVGSILPVNLAQALPTPNGSTTALTGVKFTQFLSESVLVFAGKINVLDGFNQPFTGGARGVDGFQNTGMLFNPIFARDVPYSSLGAGFAILKDLQPVISLLVLDANNTPTRSGFDTFFQNGTVIIPQINIPTKFFDLPGHQGFIGTYSSRTYTEIDRSAFFNPILGLSAPTKTGSWSLAYSFDQAFYVDPENAKRSWGTFGNLGLADRNPSPFRWFANIGIGGSSPLPGRKLDTFGIGYYYLGLNSSLKNLAPRVFPLQDEQAVELFYNVAVTPWCHISPDFQVVLPAQQKADTALVFGIRAKIDF